MRLLQEPQLHQKKILVLDAAPKNKNDRTWCFWEKENGLFESVVHHCWQKVHFLSDSFSKELDLSPYTYKMIRGIDLYDHVISFAKQFPNVEFRYETILSTITEKDKAVAVTETNSYAADYIFNSILFEKLEANHNTHFLLQHFKGWMIETTNASFDPSSATFMDFTVDQKHGTSFMYVLPVSSTKALVEYTLFTEKLLATEEYDLALKEYIGSKLNINEYSIEQEEFGIIPMTNFSFKRSNGRVINIGTAGGDTKASSGYTFQFIQKRTKKIVQSLLKDQHPFIVSSFSEKKFGFYDSVLLHVLANKKLNGDTIFSAIFSKCSPETVLRFLDNETNFADDYNIIKTLPTKIFLSAAVKEIML